jgi:putative ABC transport system permease protein
MFNLILTNLIRRPSRTLLTALGIGVGVAMIVALLSLTQGLKNSAAGFTNLGRGAFGVFQSNVADPTASVLPTSMIGQLEKVPGVSRVTPLILMVDSVNVDPAAVAFGADPSGSFAGQLVTLSGSPLSASTQGVVVGDALAQSSHLHVGGTLKVNGHTLPITGIYHSGIAFEDSGLVMGLAQAQAIAGRPAEATDLVVYLQPRAREQTVVARVEKAFPGTQVLSDADEAARASASVDLITKAVLAIIVVALIIGAITVTNTMAMAVLERQAEFGLLSAVGWNPARVALLVIGEGIGVSIIGAAIGLLLGIVGASLLVHALGVSSYVSPAITAWGLGRALLIGVAIGVLGGLYPAWRVTRMRPLKALARA